MVKGNVLHFYLRIFISRRLILIFWAIFTLIMIYYLASLFVIIFGYLPVQLTWTLSVREEA